MECPQLTVDVWYIYVSNGRRMEHSHFTVDVQGMPALWKMVRTPKLTKAQTKTN